MKKTAKSFDTVAFFRNEKKRIAKKIADLTFEELKLYLNEKSEWVDKRTKGQKRQASAR